MKLKFQILVGFSIAVALPASKGTANTHPPKPAAHPPPAPHVAPHAAPAPGAQGQMTGGQMAEGQMAGGQMAGGQMAGASVGAALGPAPVAPNPRYPEQKTDHPNTQYATDSESHKRFQAAAANLAKDPNLSKQIHDLTDKQAQAMSTIAGTKAFDNLRNDPTGKHQLTTASNVGMLDMNNPNVKAIYNTPQGKQLIEQRAMAVMPVIQAFSSSPYAAKLNQAAGGYAQTLVKGGMDPKAAGEQAQAAATDYARNLFHQYYDKRVTQAVDRINTDQIRVN
jgi:hypothetical protein